MRRENMDRRDFHKLTMAAMGGMMAGAFGGCSGEKTPEQGAGKTETPVGDLPRDEASLAAWTGEHVCRGLNACKGQGQGGNNDCAGKGECATVKEPHTCSGQNACKNLGGCGETAGQNACKGQGGCQVPLMESAWQTAYKKFKEDMSKAGYAEMLPEPPGPPKE